MSEADTDAPRALEEPPPIGGSWARLYAVVALDLAVTILLLYAFTRALR